MNNLFFAAAFWLIIYLYWQEPKPIKRHAMKAGPSRELVFRTLRGDTHAHIPSGPLAVHCAGLSEIPVKEYSENATKLAEAVIRYYEAFKPDAVWVSSDTWVTAEAMGAAVAYAAERQPLGGLPWSR